MDKHELRIMALSERLMDEGRIPWVMAPSPYYTGSYERLPVSSDIMEELGLKVGQRINSILFDAITQASLKSLKKIIEDNIQATEDSQLSEEFDFRNMMREDDDYNS